MDKRMLWGERWKWGFEKKNDARKEMHTEADGWYLRRTRSTYASTVQRCRGTAALGAQRRLMIVDKVTHIILLHHVYIVLRILFIVVVDDGHHRACRLCVSRFLCERANPCA